MLVECFYRPFVKWLTTDAEGMASAGVMDASPAEYLADVLQNRTHLTRTTNINRTGLTVEFTDEFGTLKFRDFIVGEKEELESLFKELKHG